MVSSPKWTSGSNSPLITARLQSYPSVNLHKFFVPHQEALLTRGTVHPAADVRYCDVAVAVRAFPFKHAQAQAIY